jgi:hypothetical protein
MAGTTPAGRRLTCSGARVVCRIYGSYPGLVPVLRRASARGRPPSGAREFPTVVPCPRQSLFRVSAAEDDEVIGIGDDMGLVGAV